MYSARQLTRTRPSSRKQKANAKDRSGRKSRARQSPKSRQQHQRESHRRSSNSHRSNAGRSNSRQSKPSKRRSSHHASLSVDSNSPSYLGVFDVLGNVVGGKKSADLSSPTSNARRSPKPRQSTNARSSPNARHSSNARRSSNTRHSNARHSNSRQSNASKRRGSHHGTLSVDSSSPNNFGFFDVLGNVFGDQKSADLSSSTSNARRSNARHSNSRRSNASKRHNSPHRKLSIDSSSPNNLGVFDILGNVFGVQNKQSTAQLRTKQTVEGDLDALIEGDIGGMSL